MAESLPNLRNGRMRRRNISWTPDYKNSGRLYTQTGPNSYHIAPTTEVFGNKAASTNNINDAETANNVRQLHVNPNEHRFNKEQIKKTRRGMKKVKKAAQAVTEPTKTFVKNLGVASSGYLKSFVNSTSVKAASLRTVSFAAAGALFGYLTLQYGYETIQLMLGKKKDRHVPTPLVAFKAIWTGALAGGFLGPFVGINNIFGEVKDGVLDVSTKSLLGGTVGWYLYSTLLNVARGRSKLNKIEHAFGQDNLKKIAGSLGDTYNYLTTDEKDAGGQQGGGGIPGLGGAGNAAA